MLNKIKAFQKQAKELNRDINSVEEFKRYLQAEEDYMKELNDLQQKDNEDANEVEELYNLVKTPEEFEAFVREEGFESMEEWDEEVGVSFQELNGRPFQLYVNEIIFREDHEDQNNESNGWED